MALTDNLISYWKLDESSGDAVDAHGSNTLTDTNTVGSTTGKINGGRDFESGNSEYFVSSDNASLSTGDIDFTIAAWINIESSSGRQMIVAKDSETGREFFLAYNNNGDGKLGLQVNSSAVYTASAVSTATWYHVVAWHDSVNNQLGIAVNAGTPATASYSGGTSDTGSQFRIGARQYTGFNDYFDGVIDEVGFWKRVLTSQERTDLYNSGSGLAYPFSGGGVSGTFLNQDGIGSITASGSAETVPVDGGIGTVTLTGSAGTFPVDNGPGYFVLT